MKPRPNTRIAVICACLLVIVASVAVADEGLSRELREALEAPLQARVAELLKEETAAGIANVRGSYFDRFTQVDDDTYQVTFYKRIAGEDELTAEKSKLTLSRQGAAWAITGQEVEQVVDGIFYRSVPDDETYHRFDTFRFDAEGIYLQSGPGSAYIDYWRGLPRWIVLRSDDLEYEYVPPEDVSYHGTFAALKDLYPGDFVFDTEQVVIGCSAGECQRILAESFGGLRSSTVEEIDPKLRQRYVETRNEAEDRRKNAPMSGFLPEPRPDRRWWGVSIKKVGAEHQLGLSYDNEQPEEVQFWTSDRGTVYSYYSEQSRQGDLSPTKLERRADPSGLDYDLIGLNGAVELALTDPSMMRCDLTFTLEIRRPVSRLPFRVPQVRAFRDERKDAADPSMRIHRVEDGEGRDLIFVRQNPNQGTIILPRELQPGDTLKVRARYSKVNSIYQLNRSYSYLPRSGWLPFVRFGDMIDEFDLTIKTPDQYKVLGIGTKISDETAQGVRTARFRAGFPVTFPTVIFGKYIEDEPGFPAKRLDGTTIPVKIYVDEGSTSTDAWGIRANSLRPLADQAANSLNLFSEVFGVDYPYGKLDLVRAAFENPMSGQSPASIVYLGGVLFRARGTVSQFGRDGTRTSRFMETLVAHEVGHQWWGGLVTMANWRHYWFVESLAEYSSAVFLENLHSAKDPARGRKAYMDKVEEWRRAALEAGLLTSVQDADTQWGGPFPGRARVAAIYNKGPYAFHMLRITFGDDKFFAFLRNLATELQGREIVTQDIQRIAETTFGGTMEWFFDQWIRSPGLPEFSIAYETKKTEDGQFMVFGVIRQRVVVGPRRHKIEGEYFRGAGSLTATVKGKEYTVRVTIEGQDTPFKFKLPSKPSELELNKFGEMLSYDPMIRRL